MKLNPYPGLFIDIEGLDGAGCATQVKKLGQALIKEKVKVYLTKEPTKGPIGKLVKAALEGEFNSLPPASVQLLFAADRGRHLNDEIIPRLEKSELVITDRYLWSSVAFGSINLSKQWLLELNQEFFLPDVSVLIDVSPEECLRRIKKEKISLELYERRSELENAWETFSFLANKYPFYLYMVDGEREPEEITEDILKLIKRRGKFGKVKK
jgi:dTMP kinase